MQKQADFFWPITGIWSDLSAQAGAVSYYQIMKNAPNGQKQQRCMITEWRRRATDIKERSDLLKLLSGMLEEQFTFSGMFIQSVDRHTGTYYPFVIDHLSRARSLSEFKALSNTRAPVDDPVVCDAMQQPGSFTVVLEELVNDPHVPYWIRINYDYGVKEMLVTPLKIKNEVVGISYILSQKTGTFDERSLGMMDALSMDLGYAVSNTIVNEILYRQEWFNELLLSFSRELAGVKTRGDLSRIVAHEMSRLVCFDDFMIAYLKPGPEAGDVLLSSIELDAQQRQWLLSNSFIERLFTLTEDSDLPFIVYAADLDKAAAPPCFGEGKGEKPGELLIKMLKAAPDMHFGLILTSQKNDHFDTPDRILIERLSLHLATAVANVLMNEELVRREKDKSLLLAFSHDIASVRDKEELKNAIEKTVSQLSSIARFVIRGINEDQQSLSLYIYDSNVKSAIEELGHQFVLDAIYPLNDGISDVVLAGNETVVYELQEWIDAGKAPSYFHFWRSMNVQKCIATPLKTAGRSLGIFWVDSEYPDVKMIDSICAQISVAMYNIKANEELIRYRQQLEVENEHLQEQIRSIYNSSEIIGTSTVMQDVYQLMSLVSHSNATVLLQGETGTGKELIARGIHEASPRTNKLMVKVNCAALPANLIESELFGYEKGAFTGAYERRIGKFELAHGGTLFLDEIGELPLEMQVKLLRVLQERAFERLGGKATIKVDIRIVAATNRNLKQEVDAGRFRSDLYYRLNVFPIQLPPLRDRREDIPYLAHFFLKRYGKSSLCKVTAISAAAMNELKAYHWPGNVRELEHMIERSVLLAKTGTLTKVYLPDADAGDMKTAATGMVNLESVERNHIIEVLRKCNGKISGKGGAADLLRLPASTLNSKMKKLGITKNSIVQ